MGSNLALHLKESGREFLALYRNFPVRIPGVSSLAIDLRDREQVKSLMKRFRPSWIIHCAAMTNVDWCETNPRDAYSMNGQVTRELVRGAKRAGASLLYISTDSVFDGRKGNYTEEDEPSPLNVYGRSKLIGEKAVQEEGESSLIVRTNIYGWNIQNKQSLAEWILATLESGQSVPGFVDVFFTPILVNDLSEILLEMVDRQLTGLYHVAGSQVCSKYEFAVELADLFGLDKSLIKAASLADSFLKANRPPNTSLRTTRISQTLGRPMPDLMSGIRRLKSLREDRKLISLRVC